MANMGMVDPARGMVESITWRTVERKVETVRKKVVRGKVALEKKGKEAVI